MRKRYRWIILVAALVLVGLCETTVAAEQTAPLITKEKLKSMLGDPNVIIVDIRQDKHYNPSDRKIKGAVRESMFKIKDWVSKYPKKKTMVLYCAGPNNATSAWTAQQLLKKGFQRVYALDGGWKEWIKAGYPNEAKGKAEAGNEQLLLAAEVG